MIVKITFKDGSILLFGSKPWKYTWYETYIAYINKNIGTMSTPVSAIVAGQEWLSGDLRMCKLEEFERLLEEEGRGRQPSDIEFTNTLNTVSSKMKTLYSGALKKYKRDHFRERDMHGRNP